MMGLQQRNHIVEQNLYLVPVTRRRLYPVPPAACPAEDLEGAGYLALVRAAGRYDATRGGPLRSWLIACVRWGMVEALRAACPISRADRESGVPIPEVLSLDFLLSEESTLGETLACEDPGPEDRLLNKHPDGWERIAAVLETMPERDGELLWCAFALEMPRADIARRYGYRTAPSVSDRIRKIRRRLESALGIEEPATNGQGIEVARVMRRLYGEGLSVRGIAERFGVSRAAAKEIVSGRVCREGER